MHTQGKRCNISVFANRMSPLYLKNKKKKKTACSIDISQAIPSIPLIEAATIARGEGDTKHVTKISSKLME